jgi:hypothetical protein
MGLGEKKRRSMGEIGERAIVCGWGNLKINYAHKVYRIVDCTSTAVNDLQR